MPRRCPGPEPGGAAFALLSMMKDEGPRLLEWLAHHA